MAADGITIEPLAGDADLDAVAALEAIAFSNPWTREALARELQQSLVVRAYVLRTRDEPVAGFCICWLVAGELHINTLAVAPARRRQGLAGRLLRHVIAEASAAGATDAWLEVRESNEAALALYRGLGFTVTGTRRRYYSQPEEDAILLSRSLA